MMTLPTHLVPPISAIHHAPSSLSVLRNDLRLATPRNINFKTLFFSKRDTSHKTLELTEHTGVAKDNICSHLDEF